MHIITYFAFTLLSIVMQFCVMDFIQGKPPLDKPVGLNGTSHKKRLNDVLKDLNQKPHALYYRTRSGLLTDNKSILNNLSLPEISLETATDLSSTVFELLYDENATVTEDTMTTESEFTTTDFDNITEITFFDKKNDTKQLNIKPKRTMIKDCNCNLLYGMCDINCCCDSECTDSEQKLFVNCIQNASKNKENENVCFSYSPFYSRNSEASIDSLFCVAKTNLPEKRIINNYKHDPSKIAEYYKWRLNKPKAALEFTRKPYQYGDPLWLLKNGSISYVDLPSTLMNDYCTGRRPMKFLKSEKNKCNVKLTDLEIFHILDSLEEAPLISVTEKSLNNSALNCSTLHCTNWTIIFCDDQNCTRYNRSLHDPLCTERICTNLALKVEYIFYYHESKIINATIKMVTQKLSLNIPFLAQEINVNFFIANKSAGQIVRFSGNPGYINGLPVIISSSEHNHTYEFYNNTLQENKYISCPTNINGACVISNKSDNFLLFGYNRRLKCRYEPVHIKFNHNDTDICIRIQNNINQKFGLNKKVVVSPYGNPQEQTDEEWIPLQIQSLEAPIYGGLYAKKSKLRCYNLITRISLIFTYADTSEIDTKKENKILSAKVELSANNVTFNVEDMSTVVTYDIIFIDETRPSVYGHAGGPHLNIHLPKDFLFPFPSNDSYAYKCNMCVILCVYITMLLNK